MCQFKNFGLAVALKNEFSFRKRKKDFSIKEGETEWQQISDCLLRGQAIPTPKFEIVTPIIGYLNLKVFVKFVVNLEKLLEMFSVFF